MLCKFNFFSKKTIKQDLSDLWKFSGHSLRNCALSNLRGTNWFSYFARRFLPSRSADNLMYWPISHYAAVSIWLFTEYFLYIRTVSIQFLYPYECVWTSTSIMEFLFNFRALLCVKSARHLGDLLRNFFSIFSYWYFTVNTRIIHRRSWAFYQGGSKTKSSLKNRWLGSKPPNCVKSRS